MVASVLILVEFRLLLFTPLYMKLSQHLIHSGVKTLFMVLFALHGTFAQSLSAADSLSFCGYFDQEVLVREQTLSQRGALTDQERIVETVLLQIALFNRDQARLTANERSKAVASIAKAYISADKKIQKVLYPEVGRLLAGEYTFKEQAEKALALYQNLLKSVKKDGTLEATFNLNIAQTMYHQQYRYYESIAYYKAAIAGFQRNGLANHYLNALAHDGLAYAYDKADLEQELIPNMEKALEIRTTHYAADAGLVSATYADMLSDVMDYGDRFLAKKYFTAYEKYIDKYLHDDKNNYLSSSDDFNVLGMYYLTQVRYHGFEYDKSAIYKALAAQEALFARAPADWKAKEYGIYLSSYDNAAYYLYFNLDSEEALKLNQVIEQKATNDFYRMKVSANRAMLYYYKFDYPKALIHTEKSLSYLEQLGFRSSYKTLLTLKAELLAKLGRHVESTATLKQLFELQLDKKMPLERISIEDFNGVNSSDVINILIHSGMAKKATYEKNGRKKEDLTLMKNFYRMASQMFQAYYLKGYFNPDLERQLNNIKDGLLYGCMQDPSDKDYWVKSLDAIENGSSQHLWKAYLAKHSENVNLPKELLHQKNALLMQLSFEENEQETPDSLHIAKLNKQIGDLNSEINKANPSYKRFNAADFSMQKLQQSLSADRQVLNFMVTDSSVFAVSITQKSLSIHYLGKADSLEQQVKDYYGQLKDINFDFMKASKRLYQQLLKPVLLNELSQVTILNEDFLHYLPYESLMNANDEFLTNTHEVSYANGLRFLNMSSVDLKPKYTYTFSGFAPTYGSDVVRTRAENGQLIYTGKELNAIAETIGRAAVFINEKATKQNFLNSLGKSNIHHLAMHSQLDENDYNYSRLVFQNNENLYFHELYNLNFPSELVVLSACNTGVGQYLNGEGLMSISRALNYAGVKSTVYSLWQVPDKETSDLMVLFYQNIEQGLAKDAALALAKKQFVSQHSTKSHPYFWAGFVLNGDVSPVEKSIDWKRIVVMALAALVLLFLARKWLYNFSNNSAAFRA